MMGRLWCIHDMPDEFCEECNPPCLHPAMTAEHDYCPDCGEVYVGLSREQYGAVQAWYGLVMWCTYPLPEVERLSICGGCEFRDLSTEIRCQAWQEFRDFLDGTPEQWQQTAYNAYIEGRDDTRRGLWDSSSEVRDE